MYLAGYSFGKAADEAVSITNRLIKSKNIHGYAAALFVINGILHINKLYDIIRDVFREVSRVAKGGRL